MTTVRLPVQDGTNQHIVYFRHPDNFLQPGSQIQLGPFEVMIITPSMHAGGYVRARPLFASFAQVADALDMCRLEWRESQTVLSFPTVENTFTHPNPFQESDQ